MKQLLAGWLIVFCYQIGATQTTAASLSERLATLDTWSKMELTAQLPDVSIFETSFKMAYPPLSGISQQSSQPLIYNYQDLAFFCKLEVDLEKAVKMPIRFRLGTVEDVDYLEGKRERY